MPVADPNFLRSRLPQPDIYFFDAMSSHAVGSEASRTDHMLAPENCYRDSNSQSNLIGLTPTEHFSSWDVTSAF
jgi:hypothetical protein